MEQQALQGEGEYNYRIEEDAKRNTILKQKRAHTKGIAS